MYTKKDSGRLDWHLAFYQAMQMELFEYFDDIDIACEHQLTSEPLRIDLLIVKKRRDVIINKSIGRIFRGHNIIEYKSPGDSFSAKDFLQVCAYAIHYAANTSGVEDADISLTFAGSRYPRVLMRYLTEKRKYAIAQSASGVYLVTGDYLPIQIIETKRLPETESLWLKSLTNDLRISSARAILQECNDDRRKLYLDAYLDILLRSNRKIFAEVRSMARRYPTLEEALDEIGLPNWVRQGKEVGRAEEKEKIAGNLLAEGMSVEQVARVTEMPQEKVRALKKSGMG